MKSKNNQYLPQDQKWIDIDWEIAGVRSVFDDLKPALETFGLQIWEINTEEDCYEWYVYDGPWERGGQISQTIQNYWDEHEDMHSNEEDYGLGYPWKKIVTDWKLNGGMVPQFQEAAALFGVKIYILPDDYEQERLLITRAELTLDEVKRLESEYYDEEKLLALKKKKELKIEENQRYFEDLKRRVEQQELEEARRKEEERRRELALNEFAKEHFAYEKSDKNIFQREARVLQSLWREGQGYPIGEHKHKGKSRPLGSRLAMPWAKETLANYLTDTIKDVVRAEVLDPSKSKGKLYGKPRIFNDLLSSQPLCFNLFGELQRDLPLATKVFNELVPNGIQEVTAVEFEYSPGRGDERYTGDRSAFDVYVAYETTGGGKGFLGIEVKYHENLEGKAAEHRERYDEIAEMMGCFIDYRYDWLKEQPLQQIWRDHLLVGIHKEVDGFQEGYFVFLYPCKNYACLAALWNYQDVLSDEDSFLHWTIEEVLEAIKDHTDQEWPDLIWDRYLDFGKVDKRLVLDLE